MTPTTSESGLARPLPELELEVMKALWRLETGTVAAVKEQLDRCRAEMAIAVIRFADALAQ